MADHQLHHLKTCTKCNSSLAVEQFPRDKSRTDGRFPWCKSCKSEESKKAYKADPQPAKLRAARHREKNPDAMKAWRASNRGHIKTYNASWYWSRREAEREREKLWRARNPEYAARYYA